jgi:hypothetical protein
VCALLRLKLSEKVRLKLPKWSTEAADGVATHFADIDDQVFLRRLLNENVLFDGHLKLARERWHQQNQDLSPRRTEKENG